MIEVIKPYKAKFSSFGASSLWTEFLEKQELSFGSLTLERKKPYNLPKELAVRIEDVESQSSVIRIYGGRQNIITEICPDKIPNSAKIARLFAWEKGALEIMCMLEEVCETTLNELITQTGYEKQIKKVLPELEKFNLVSINETVVMITELGRKVMGKLQEMLSV